MKQLFYFSIFLFALTTFSCRKERTCKCTTVTTDVKTGNNAGTTQSTSSSIFTEEKQIKKEFVYANNCFSNKGTETYFGGGSGQTFTVVSTYEKTCELL